MIISCKYQTTSFQNKLASRVKTPGAVSLKLECYLVDCPNSKLTLLILNHFPAVPLFGNSVSSSNHSHFSLKSPPFFFFSSHPEMVIQRRSPLAEILLHSLSTFWSQRPSWPSSCSSSWCGSSTGSSRSATASITMATWRLTSTAPRSRRCETRPSGYWATSSPSMWPTSSRFLLL